MKKIFPYIIWFLILVITFLGVYIFFPWVIQQVRGIYIDRYNFQQLEKFKEVVGTINEEQRRFSNLEEFNSLYGINIQAKKNCYYISSSNGNEKYIFAFKLESKRYQEKYGEEYYVYPKYDLPKDYAYFWMWNSWPIDRMKNLFQRTISNPCQD